jgi:HSP90 family molecular chaperone
MSIEQANIDEIRKEMGLAGESQPESRLPEEDVTNFCLWLKNILSDRVMKVQISKRLSDVPAVVVG